MNIKQQLAGLNEFLTAIYGTDTRLSSLLTSLGFRFEQVELIRNQHLEHVVASFLESLQERMATGQDGERLHHVVSRWFGLDGAAPDTFETLGRDLHMTPEMVRQLEEKALGRCKTKANLQFLRAALHTIALKLIDEVTDRPEPQSIVSKLGELEQIRTAIDVMRAEYEAKRTEVLNKVASELDALEEQYASLFKASTEHMTGLEAEIKNDALRYGETIYSDQLCVVYSKARISWDTKGIAQYAESHPELLQYRKQGEPTAKIQVRRKIPV
ncbi:MAG: hypothetical protein HY680_04680 [Chloroflexi bacterium]|nr:hypothetical protein [Chloroflexota bacterium]